MIKLIKSNLRLVKLTDDINKKNELLLQNYLMILGYLVSQNDHFFTPNYTDQKIIDLEQKIQKILNINYKIIGIKNNSKDSFDIFVNNYNNENNKKTIEILNKYFYLGYNYYINFYERHNSIVDYIIGTQKNLEMKLRNII